MDAPRGVVATGKAVGAYRHDITLSPDHHDQVLAGLRARLTPAT